MIKGIIALFTSGLITNPMVILGIILGAVFYGLLDADSIFKIYKTPSFYGVALMIACGYVLGFRRVYTSDGDTDWTETSLAIAGSVFKFVLSSLLMISFISMFDVGDMAGLDGNVEMSPEGL